VGLRRFEQPRRLPPATRTTRTYLSDGGCVTFDFEFDADNASLVGALDTALSFQPRGALVAAVDERTGLSLCGAGAPPCVGGR
jgi:hypothetical protein